MFIFVWVWLWLWLWLWWLKENMCFFYYYYFAVGVSDYGVRWWRSTSATRCESDAKVSQKKIYISAIVPRMIRVGVGGITN